MSETNPCPICARENPVAADFCACGEYLRWERTGVIEAVTPVAPVQPKAVAPAPVVLASPTPTAPWPQKAPATAAPRHEDAAPATIVLRAATGDSAKGAVLHHAVEPGQTERIFALVRNQSGIVDNYDLRVEGLPEEWWSIHPGTIYLVPFGSGGTYEQEVEVHLHPPRTPAAEARVWELKVVADSKAHRIVAASAPLALHVSPYTETATALRPQRRRGRRKATYDVTVTNRANSPVLVALDGEDPDGELRFGFNRPPQEIPAGGAVTTQMQVRPPKQMWIGRNRERRLEVRTVTGEEAAARAAAEPLAAAVLENAPPPKQRRFWPSPRVPGMYPPRVYKPQLHAPDVQLGPGGINVRMPQLRGPQVTGPQIGGKVGMPKLRGGGAQAPAGPLMPSHGVFRQQPWLPWWLLPLLLLLAVLLVLLFKFILPHNVVVPDVVGKASAFEAEATLTESDLVLDPNPKTEVDDTVKPGTILDQTPKQGTESENGAKVTILIAVSSENAKVPKIVGLTASDADKALRQAQLSLGTSAPPGAPSDGTIVSQIPDVGEEVKRGTPINIFFAPEDAPSETPTSGSPEGPEQPADDETASEVVVPAAPTSTLAGFARELSTLGLVPKVERVVDGAPRGRVIATLPPAGTAVARGGSVSIVVSAGFPRVVFSDGEDVQLVDGASGRPIRAIAARPEVEEGPTWAPDATRIAYVSQDTVLVADTSRPGEPHRRLAGTGFKNLAWSERGDVLALSQGTAVDSDLCLLATQPGATASCKREPAFAIARTIHWAPDGLSILATGRRTNEATAGIVRWTTNKAFSPDAADWSEGEFTTDLDAASSDVIDAAISPDGKRLAAVSDLGKDEYRLVLTDADDLALERARPTALRACKVAWRPDGRELLITQADRGCQENAGALVRLDPAHPERTTHIAIRANDPSYQPG